jgi:hypothetical protein
VICAEEHRREIRPHDLKKTRRKYLCSVCSGKDKAAAEARLWAEVAKHGARPAKGAKYINSYTPVPLVCEHGHRCAPLPGNVLAGHGVCDRCRSTYDRVYLLVHPTAGAVKVGVTGSDARVRGHAGRGYRLVAQWTGLEHEAALAAERAVLACWRTGGLEPVAAAPRNGRTETAPIAQLAATRAHLGLLLGAPSERPALPPASAMDLAA